MPFKFHYNKTTIQQFKKQLGIRQRALPILKNKETALRQEEKKCGKELKELLKRKDELDEQLKSFQGFWSQLPDILALNDRAIYTRKIVGVKVPEIKDITFSIAEISWWKYPPWVPSAIHMLKKSITLDIELEVKSQQIDLLKSARKKTTQKVNLYEKVQIPEYESAIMKIKRFLEDKENISKAAQKIVKIRQEEGVTV